MATSRARKVSAAADPAKQQEPAPPSVPAKVEPEKPMPTNVVAAIARVQGELGGIERLTPRQRQAMGMQTGDSEKGISYAYRGIDQIAAAVQPLFGRYGVVVLPWIEDYSVEQIEVRGNPWTDHSMTVLWTIYGPGGKDDWITARTIGLGRDNSDKGANKAMTGAHKNLLLKLLSIGDPKDDPDNEKVESTARANVQNVGVHSDVAVVVALLNTLPEEPRKAAKWTMIDTFGTPPEIQDDESIANLRKWASEHVAKIVSQPPAPAKPTDGSDGGPGHAEPIEKPELGEALTEALHPDADALPAEGSPITDAAPEPEKAAPAGPMAKEAMPEGCDIVGTRCRVHKRPAAECRAEFGAEQSP